MRHALALGRRGLGRVWPNPAVGCVIVKDGRVVGRGRTADGGRPHGEPQALAMAGEAARGATVYVTLEPCSHHGKTPPCAEALIAAGVARVVVALEDPDPRVSGRGLTMLRDAGIQVDVGLCANEARSDQAGFLSRVTEGRPLVTLKLASSFDGRIATATGESQWITGPEARHYVHGLRATHDAVMVGGGTARADDPMLTVRGYGDRPQPVRVVLSRKLDLPSKSALAETARDVPLWLCHSGDASPEAIAAWEAAGARCLLCDGAGRHLDPAAVLKRLADEGLTRVFCEGGGSLAASLLVANTVDRLVGMTAGIALGAEGTPAIGALGVDVLAEAPAFQLQEVRRLGGDTLHIWQRT